MRELVLQAFDQRLTHNTTTRNRATRRAHRWQASTKTVRGRLECPEVASQLLLPLQVLGAVTTFLAAGPLQFCHETRASEAKHLL